jgi:hypothetical protein
MKSRAPLNEPALPRRRLYGHPLTTGYKKRLARSYGEKVAEAIADWVAVVREELQADGEIPILAIALAELARQYEQAEKAGLNDLAQIIRKHLADCAAAVLRAEDMSRSGPNCGVRNVTERPHGKANRNNRRFTPARRAA